MKTSFLSFFLLALCLFSNATNKIVIGNTGQGWANGNNFSPTGVPQSGDSVTIPAGLTLTVKGNIYGTMSLLKIYIYGIMDFDPSGKLDLTVSSLVQIYAGGSITTNGTSSEIITMGGVTKYNGQNDGVVTGPKYASAATSISNGIADDAGFNFGVLPINLIAFELRSSPSEVTLSWKLQGSPDIDKYTIQKRTNEVWLDIKTETLAERSKEITQTYFYIDRSANEGKNYYRLKFINHDGAIGYSKILMTNINVQSASVSLYPNPVKNVAVLRLNGITKVSKVAILSVSGTMVWEKQLAPGSNQLSIDFSMIKKGIYYVVLSEDNKILERSCFIVSH